MSDSVRECVADRTPHKGSGPNLSDQAGSLGGRLTERLLVALKNHHVCLTGLRQVAGGAQAPHAAPDDQDLRLPVHPYPSMRATGQRSEFGRDQVRFRVTINLAVDEEQPRSLSGGVSAPVRPATQGCRWQQEGFACGSS